MEINHWQRRVQSDLNVDGKLMCGPNLHIYAYVIHFLLTQETRFLVRNYTLIKVIVKFIYLIFLRAPIFKWYARGLV